MVTQWSAGDFSSRLESEKSSGLKVGLLLACGWSLRYLARFNALFVQQMTGASTQLPIYRATVLTITGPSPVSLTRLAGFLGRLIIHERKQKKWEAKGK